MQWNKALHKRKQGNDKDKIQDDSFSGGGGEAREQDWRNYMVTCRLLSGPTFALYGGFMDAYYVIKNNYCS